MRRLNSIRFGRKATVGVLSVLLVTLAIVYAVIQPRSGFAVLTTPPPGIPGPYYVTAEAKIYGPVVDLAAIKSKMGGTYASDYTYVQWGANPFYRVYADNTLQEVYYGQMKEVLNSLAWYFSIENSILNTFTNLKNNGAIDPSSICGNVLFLGNMPGTVLAFFVSRTSGENVDIVANTTRLHAVAASFNTEAYGSSNTQVRLWVYHNGSQVVYLEGSGQYASASSINATGGDSSNYNWTLILTQTYSTPSMAVAIYQADLLDLQTTLPSSKLRVYNIVDSPGTGFVSKYLAPSSPVAGSTVNVTARLDPPSAASMNITDMYPNTFTWASVDVLLEKFKIGVGLEENAYVNVVPTPDGSNMKFTIYYNQAPSILQSLLSDEYVYLTYSLRVPDVAGEYTLPAASMSYLIPTPQP